MTTPSGEERRAQRAERQRPPTSYNSWILITVTVSTVIFMGLITWYGRFPTWFSLDEPSDHEVIHQLAEGWAERWPQVPGPPDDYTAEARQQLADGLTVDAVQRLTQSLALDPNAPTALLLLVIASAQAGEGTEGALGHVHSAAVVEVVAETDPESPLLPAARAWLALRDEDPGAALAVLEGGAETPEGALARLRAVVALDQSAEDAAARLLMLAPGSREGCEALARARLLMRQPADALQVLEGCQRAGAQGRLLDRLRGDALDGVGQLAAAAEAYLRAGADSHAAAIFIQEPALGAEEAKIDALLEGDAPGVALHRLWWGLLSGEERRSAAAARVLRGLQMSGLEFDVALAAEALARGDAEAALARVEGSEAPEALVIKARALLAQGDVLGADEAAVAALRQVPWNPWVRSVAVETSPGEEVAVERVPSARLVAARQRSRQMPWPALVPGVEVVEVADVEEVWVGLRDGEVGAELAAVQGALQGGEAGEVVAALEAAVRDRPEASGLQMLLVEARRRAQAAGAPGSVDTER